MRRRFDDAGPDDEGQRRAPTDGEAPDGHWHGCIVMAGTWNLEPGTKNGNREPEPGTWNQEPGTVLPASALSYAGMPLRRSWQTADAVSAASTGIRDGTGQRRTTDATAVRRSRRTCRPVIVP